MSEAEQHNTKFVELYEAKQYDEAEVEILKAVEADPTHTDSLFNYATFLQEVKKDYDKADEYYTKCLQTTPNDAVILGSFADFQRNITKNYEKAEELYMKALEINPTDDVLLSSIAQFYKDGKREYDKAEGFFEKAVEFNPKNTSLISNYAQFLKSHKKDFVKAEQYYLKALETNPKHSSTLNNYAQFLKEIKKDFETAEEFYKRAVDSNPNHVDILYNYATFLMSGKKDFDNAAEWYLRVLTVKPSHTFSLYHLAQYMHFVKKEYDQADTYYQRAIKSNPNHVDSLCGYATFLKGVRKDYEQAEQVLNKVFQKDERNAKARAIHDEILAEKAAGAGGLKPGTGLTSPVLGPGLSPVLGNSLTPVPSPVLGDSPGSQKRKIEPIADTKRNNTLSESSPNSRRPMPLTQSPSFNANQGVLPHPAESLPQPGSASPNVPRPSPLQPKYPSNNSSSSPTSLSGPPNPMSLSGAGLPPALPGPVSASMAKASRSFSSPPRVLEPLSKPSGQESRAEAGFSSDEILATTANAGHNNSNNHSSNNTTDSLSNSNASQQMMLTKKTSELAPELDFIRVDMGEDKAQNSTPGLDMIRMDLGEKNPDGKEVDFKEMHEAFLWYTDPKTGKEMKYEFNQVTTNIGRKEDNDIVIMSKYVSRYHARIDAEVRDGVSVLIFKDLSERSRVNGVKPGDHVLMKGDQLKLGKTLMVFLDKSDEPMITHPEKEGPGWKQGTNLLKSWQQHYIVLQGHVLFMFKSQKDRITNQLPQFIIDIDGCTIEKDEETTFTIDCAKKQHCLKFQPPAMKDEWLDLIRVISKLR